jgi:hypothetical protein
MNEIEQHIQNMAANLACVLKRLVDAHEFVKQNPNATGLQVLLIISDGDQPSEADFQSARDTLKALGIPEDKQ